MRAAALFATVLSVSAAAALAAEPPPPPEFNELNATISRQLFAGGAGGWYFDQETGLYSTPSGRYYDPDTGRFIQQDALEYGNAFIPPSLHRYTYVHNNPATLTDPSGHQAAPQKGALDYFIDGFMALWGKPTDPGVGAVKRGQELAYEGAVGTKELVWDVGRLTFGDPMQVELKSGPGQVLTSGMSGGEVRDALMAGAIDAATEGPANLIIGLETGDLQRAGKGALDTGLMAYGVAKTATAMGNLPDRFVVGEGGGMEAPGRLTTFESVSDASAREQMLRYADELQGEMARREAAWPDQQRALLESGEPVGMAVEGSSAYRTRIDPSVPGRPDPKFSIDSHTFTEGEATSQGGLRNTREFWQQWSTLQPDSLSKSNRYLIENYDKLKVSPRIDDQWIKVFPEHADYKGQVLIHHHVDFGRYAVPVPGETHVGSGGPFHAR